MSTFESTKIIELGSCAFRQPRAESHCKFLHGYRLTAKFWFSCNTLDINHWVVDFGALKPLKSQLENQFDHTTCIAADDPALPYFQELTKVGACDLRIMPNGTGIERIAEWCFKAASEFIERETSGRCWVNKVEVWEHDKNSAVCYEQNIFNNTPRPLIDPDELAKAEKELEKFIEEDQKPEEQPKSSNDPIPAAVGNPISTGLGNPFGGTSWSASNGDSMR